MFRHLKPVPASFLLSVSGAASRQDETLSVPWPDGHINPNEATLRELDALPGIGPVTAMNIVAERTQNGGFVFPEDLLSVKGIGPATFEALWASLSLPLP